MIDMSIIDDSEIDVVALQRGLNQLREENQSLRQENTRLKAWKNLADEWSQDIDKLYHMIYGEDAEENCHTMMLKITNMFSTKKGKLLLKFLI